MLSYRTVVSPPKRTESDSTRTAKEFAKLATKEPHQAYNAACSWSLLAGLSSNDAKAKGESAAEAVRLLRQTPIGPEHHFKKKTELAEWIANDRDLDFSPQ